MRGRRPVGPEYAEQLVGSETAKLRAKVILETMAGKCRLKEACQLLGISEQRFHQLREEMMTAAVKARTRSRRPSRARRRRPRCRSPRWNSDSRTRTSNCTPPRRGKKSP